MAVVLRSTKGSALTHAELDGNFSDYSTFKALFDTTEFSGSNNGQFLFWNNSNNKVEVKSLESSDVTDAITSQFNSLLATKTTAHLTEGANLYYTDARVDTRIGSLNTDVLSEGSTNFYYTNARVDARLNSILPTKTTDDITEGSKLYYTDVRVDARFNTRRLTHLAGVDGVDATTDGKVLYYDHSSTTFKWKTDAAAGNLTNLSDVDTVSHLDNDKFLYYNHGTTSFKWKAVATNTDGLIEGSTNLYYTDARFDTRLANKTTANLPESVNLYYTNARVDAHLNQSNPTSGYVLSWNGSDYAWVAQSGGGGGPADTDALNEGSSNLYFTNARADARVDAGFSSKSTTNLSEGTNLYYTNARADARADVRIAASSLYSLANVFTGSNPTDGQVLTWDNANSYWKPETVSGGGIAGDITAVIAGTGLTGGGTSGSATLNVDVGTTANKIVQLDGSARLPAIDGSLLTNLPGGGGGGTPGGANTQVQFNNSGAFGADSDFTYNSTTNTLTVVNLIASSISPPSTLSGTYSITSPTTLTLDPTDEIINDAPMKLKGYASGSVPGTASAGSMIAISNQGYKPAYYDGSAWRYVHDNSAV